LGDRWWDISDEDLEKEWVFMMEQPLAERIKIEMAMIEKEYYEQEHKLH